VKGQTCTVLVADQRCLPILAANLPQDPEFHRQWKMLGPAIYSMSGRWRKETEPFAVFAVRWPPDSCCVHIENKAGPAAIPKPQRGILMSGQ